MTRANTNRGLSETPTKSRNQGLPPKSQVSINNLRPQTHRNSPLPGDTESGSQGLSGVSNGLKETPSKEVSGLSPLIEGLRPLRPRPQRWRCPLCKMTYESPLPLKIPPVHRCAPTAGGTPRLRNFTLEQETTT